MKKESKEVIFERIQKVIFDGFSEMQGWQTVDDMPGKVNEVILKMAEKEFNDND